MSLIFYVDGVNFYVLTPASYVSAVSHNRESTVGSALHCVEGANQKQTLKTSQRELFSVTVWCDHTGF